MNRFAIMASISGGFVFWQFFPSELRDLKKNEIFAEVNKNLPIHVVFVSMPGENPAVLKLAMDNLSLSLCDSCDFSACLLLIAQTN